MSAAWSFLWVVCALFAMWCLLAISYEMGWENRIKELAEQHKGE